jgi:RNA recognition motif-containing protein
MVNLALTTQNCHNNKQKIMGNEINESKLKNAILSTLEGSGGEKVRKLPVKELRTAVLLSLQQDLSDKTAKKSFKKTVQSLEDEGTLSLSTDGIVKLKKKKQTTTSKTSKKEKSKRSREENLEVSSDKKRKSDKDHDDEVELSSTNDVEQTDDPVVNEQEVLASSNPSDPDKNKPCKGNPQGVTRLFLGNLPFAVDETSLNDFLLGHVTHIKWITDKETGKFYGSAFIEMDTSESASQAVAKAGQSLMGRPIKINFAPALPGDMWPPPTKTVTGGGTGVGGHSSTAKKGQAGGVGLKAMSEKPENCTKLFIGNLSYDIDDEVITKFFANVEAEVKAVRWIHHKDTGDFKGVGFVEFWNTEACERGAKLNGKTLLGRPIRIDWTD